MDICILDFDSSLTSQEKLLRKYNPKVINLTDLSSLARLWMSLKTAREIRQRIGKSLCNLNLLGSGDFHHISCLFTEEIKEPVALIVFDFHPDWDILPPALGCGSWVTRAMKNPNILKCFIVGASSEDLSFPYIQSGNLRSLKNNRLEIYPYEHCNSSVFLRRVPLNRSIKVINGLFRSEIEWEQIKGKDLKGFFLSLISGLPTRKVYVSIDKDCLVNDYAVTNWEEGVFTLEELMVMLKLIKDNLDIVGLDITGEYSIPKHPNAIKALISRLDHPRNNRAQEIEERANSTLNEETNLKILSLFAG